MSVENENVFVYKQIKTDDAEVAIPFLAEHYASRLGIGASEATGEERVEELYGILTDDWDIKAVLAVGVFDLLARQKALEEVAADQPELLGEFDFPVTTIEFSALSTGWRDVHDQGKADDIWKYQTTDMATLHGPFSEMSMAGENYEHLKEFSADRLGQAWVGRHSCKRAVLPVGNVQDFYDVTRGEQKVRTGLDMSPRYEKDVDEAIILANSDYTPQDAANARNIIETAEQLVIATTEQVVEISRQ